MSISFDMRNVSTARERDNGLSANECYPQMLRNDPSFALLNNDLYVIGDGIKPS